LRKLQTPVAAEWGALMAGSITATFAPIALSMISSRPRNADHSAGAVR